MKNLQLLFTEPVTHNSQDKGTTSTLLPSPLTREKPEDYDIRATRPILKELYPTTTSTSTTLKPPNPSTLATPAHSAGSTPFTTPKFGQRPLVLEGFFEKDDDDRETQAPAVSKVKVLGEETNISGVDKTEDDTM